MDKSTLLEIFIRKLKFCMGFSSIPRVSDTVTIVRLLSISAPNANSSFGEVSSSGLGLSVDSKDAQALLKSWLGHLVTMYSLSLAIFVFFVLPHWIQQAIVF